MSPMAMYVTYAMAIAISRYHDVLALQPILVYVEGKADGIHYIL